MIETIRPNEFIDELKFGYTVKMEGYTKYCGYTDVI